MTGPRARRRAQPRAARSSATPEKGAYPKNQKRHYLVVRQVDEFTVRLWDMWGDEHGDLMVEHKFTTPVQLLNFETHRDDSIEADDVAKREWAEGEAKGVPENMRTFALDAVVYDAFEHNEDFCIDGIANETEDDCVCHCLECRRDHWPLDRA
jgi:hypothetical protein